jgi:hypothetical protein
MAIRRFLWALPLVALVTLVPGCSNSSALFSDAERQSIYTIGLSSPNQGKVVSGSSLLPGSVISVSMSRMSGAKNPEAMVFTVLDAGRNTLATLRYATPRAAVSSIATTPVADLSSTLPDFKIPANLTSGQYFLDTILYDASDTQLQSNETVFFVAPQGFGLGSISMCPLSAAPSSAVFFAVSVNTSPSDTTTQPWLRWSSEGRTFAEGPLAQGADRAVWKAPALDGAYSVDVELFPGKPASTIGLFTTPWHSSAKPIVSKDAVLPDEFSDDTRLVSHLHFEGDFSDSGTRSQPSPPASFGTPTLNMFTGDVGGGFGYTFGPDAGVNIPGAVPPMERGALEAFSFLWRVYAQGSSGDLVKIAAPDGTVLFHAGLEAGHPFAETIDAAGTHRSRAEGISVEQGLSDIALSVEPSPNRLNLVWNVNGISYRDAGSLPVTSLPSNAGSVLGGPSSLPGIYDEFAISLDTNGPPALYHAAALRQYKNRLFIAEGFEAAGLPAGTTASGDVKTASRRLELGKNGSLDFDQALSLSRPFHIEANYEGRSAPLAVVLSGAAGPLLYITASGEVLGADQTLLGPLPPVAEGSLDFTVKALPQGKGLELTSGSMQVNKKFRAALQVALPSVPESLKVSLACVGDGAAVVDSFLVRAAPEELSSLNTRSAFLH